MKTVNFAQTLSALVLLVLGVCFFYPNNLYATLQSGSSTTGESSSALGSVTITGDFDGDSDSDLAVSATSYNSNQGRVYILYNDGSYPSGAGSANVIITGEATGDNFGFYITSGDLDNDNDDDLIVSAKGASGGNGRAYVFYNDGDTSLGSSCSGSNPTLCNASGADLIITGSGGDFGQSIVAGDLDDDNDDDLSISAFSYSSGSGAAFIFYQDGSWPTAATSADVTITGPAFSYFGTGQAIGDLDNDNDDDLVIGTSWYNALDGGAFIFYNDGSYPSLAANADVIITGDRSAFADHMAIGNMDGDSDLDLVVCAASGSGTAYIFYQDGSWPTASASADEAIAGDTNTSFCTDLAIGDLDGDGDTDLAAGAKAYNSNQGRAYVFYNDGSWPSSVSGADETFTGENTSDLFGSSLAAGDLDVGSSIDLAVGATGYSSSAGRSYVYTQTVVLNTEPDTTVSVSNFSPVITTTPSDGGSAGGTGTGDTSGNPTNVGSDVTFTSTAKDINTDSYYLALCKTDAVTGGGSGAPTCDGGNWAISTVTATDVQASVTYTALVGDVESNVWYAFVCDNAATGLCYPASAAGDQGLALGTVTFSDVPADEDDIIIDSIQYRFDTGGDGCVGAGTCIDVSANEDGADAATSFVAAEVGTSSHMTNRGAVAYVYADTEGVGGNSLGMTIGTCANCALSGATLAGGDASNMSPFKVNHVPSFSTVAIGPTCNASGSVDPGNSLNGTVTTAISGNNDWVTDLELQPDGKVLAGGYTNNGSDTDFALVRYNADGTLDTSFDTDGIVTTAIGSGNDNLDSFVILSDGKILAGGDSIPGANRDFTLVRYNTDGSLDTTFDTDGIVTTALGSGHDNGDNVAIQSDGKIVQSGEVKVVNWEFGLVRYNSDGSLDTSFSGDGKVITPAGSGDSFVNALAIQDDGKILIAGSAIGSSNQDIALVRYNTDGSLDTTFDTDGIVITPIGSGAETSTSISFDENGKIVVTGYYLNVDDFDIFLARYNTDGSLDTTFDTDGIATLGTTTGNDIAWDSIILSDGKIMVSGYYDNGTDADYALLRYNSNGSLDTSFDTDGIVTTAVGSGNDYGKQLIRLPDGRFVLEGNYNNGSDDDFAFVRYTSDGALDDLTDYICIEAAVADSDTDGSTDTVDMHVCSTNSFTGGTCDGTTLCIAEDVEAGYNAQCAAEDQAPVPSAHGSYDVYVFIVDNHGFQGTGTATNSYTIADVAPVLTSYTAIDAPAPAAGGSDTVDFSVAFTDDNGDNDVTGVEGVLFEDTTVANTCTADENDCYIDATCTLTSVSTPGSGKTATGTDNALGADCQVTVWFNAADSANWEVQTKPTDGLGQETGFADSNVNLTNSALQGIDITQASIAFGTVAIGGTSSGAETSMGNMGNQVLDVYIDGDNMCTDFPGCAGDTIAIGQQKWHHNASTFDWDASAAPGPYATVDTASGTADAGGCMNRDIAIRNDHTLTTTNESIYWKLRIPAAQGVGSYTGQNTFATTASSTCSTGQSY